MTTPFPVHGQGVFVFSVAAGTPTCTIQLTSANESQGLMVEFGTGYVHVLSFTAGERLAASMKPLPDPNNKAGLSTHQGAYYWFSLDSQNQRLYAGVGEARLETAVYSYTFPDADKATYEANKAFLESITHVSCPETVIPIRVIKDPITRRVPLVVKDTDDLTMDDVAANAFLPKANLSHIGQKLYDCIAGKRFTLNTPDFPDFTAAIEHSIRTPGLWCYQKLQDKSREFNPNVPDLSETYLRITLGENNGESPGVPYVMEIWPVGHYSPIHNHAAADAIIRVLAGEINVSLYPFLCAEKDGVAPFGASTFTEGQITWISPRLNQTHKLKNLEKNSATCITIQCYMYPGGDKTHYDYFDYIDSDGNEKQYEPDSDMDFVAFKELMRKEWEARPHPTSKRCWSLWR